MGQQRKAERAARSRERSILAGPFRADALTLADVFPEAVEGSGVEHGRLTATVWGPGLTLREEGSGLLLACNYATAWGSPVMQGRDLAYGQVLDLIRAGGLVPAQLELVLAPAGATGAWSLDGAERVTFHAGEWRLVGWKHRSQNRIARVHEQLRRLGMEIEPGPPYLELHFRLAPKVPNVERKRLLAARATFEGMGVRRGVKLPAPTPPPEAG